MSALPLLCLGAAHWDILAHAGLPLAEGADVPGRVRRRPGGVALNVALGLAAAGVPVALRAAVGADAEGAALLRALAQRGIDVSRCLVQGHTDAYVAIEDPGGEVFAAVADCRALEAAGAALVADLPGEVAVDGNLPAALLADPAPFAGRRLHLVAASPAKARALLPLLPHAATLFVNLREAAALLGTRPAGAAEAAGRLLALGPVSAVVTDGPHPAACAAGSEVVTERPGPRGAGGATGAGDALVAGHLAGLRAGLSAGDAFSAAMAAAAAHLRRGP